ncbi:hypothetical protein [Sporolactobacillus terrae]|uniref:hypothetical protein n=1 Tax=Sporolactobacillus terrae TaxID=269673 RepID=UPI00111BA9C3|nr:hypothetical protein [Sporolactobacillus terrae]
MSYFERDKDYQNYRKANYYDYEKTDGIYRASFKSEKKDYADKQAFKTIMDAQEHLLNVLMPRFRTIDRKLDDLIEQNKTIQRRLHILEDSHRDSEK